MAAFPIGVSNPPPPAARAWNGRPAWAELRDGGVTFVRTGAADWNARGLGEQLAVEQARLDAAARHGLECWLYLGELPNLPAAGAPERERLLEQVVRAFRGHEALLGWKGIDEPRNPARTPTWIRPEPLVRAYKKVKTLDREHPLVIIQAPRSTVAQLTPYRPAFDITGVDVFPVSYPPGVHTSSRNKDVSVVGDWVRVLRRAAGTKPVWATLQIAFSGTARSKRKPDVLPRFPTLKEERFMAHQAIVAGARAVNFFGGHLTQVMTPRDAALGWNWTFWEQVLRPLVRELSSPDLAPALMARDVAGVRAKPGYPNIELVNRRAGAFHYVIAVKRGGPTVQVEFTGVPKKRNGTAIASGEVLFEHVQSPPPPPFDATKVALRRVTVSRGGFEDWLAAHDVRVYRFRV